MIGVLIGLVIIALLLWLAYVRIPKLCPPAPISKSVPAYGEQSYVEAVPGVGKPDNQYELFRDMEPNTQVKENPWIGVLQEDLTKSRTGNIGTFSGTDSKSGNLVAYMIT
jgi:hypothetical protein